MDRRKLLATGAAAGATALVGPAVARAGDQGLVGSWFDIVNATDPPLGSFHGLITFGGDGTVVETRRPYVPASPFGPLIESGGRGAWERTGNRTYEAFFRFLLQQAPPSPGAEVATDNVRLWLTLDGDRLTGRFESNIKELASGAVIFTARGTFAAERITV